MPISPTTAPTQLPLLGFFEGLQKNRGISMTRFLVDMVDQCIKSPPDAEERRLDALNRMASFFSIGDDDRRGIQDRLETAGIHDQEIISRVVSTVTLSAFAAMLGPENLEKMLLISKGFHNQNAGVPASGK